MASRKIGQVLDSLGVEVNLDEADLPTDAIVILKVVKEDGSVSLIKGRSESVDWITGVGMMTVAQEIENSGYADVSGEDS